MATCSRRISPAAEWLPDNFYLVEDQIRRVMRALIERDDALAQEVIERDRQGNTYDVEGDEQCVSLLALHQPMAADLRVIGHGSSFQFRGADKAARNVGAALGATGDFLERAEELAKAKVDVVAIDSAAIVVWLTPTATSRCTSRPEWSGASGLAIRCGSHADGQPGRRVESREGRHSLRAVHPGEWPARRRPTPGGRE